MNRTAAILLLLFLVTSGCRGQKKTPVVELSAEQSGVEILEREFEISNADWPGWRGADGNGIAKDQNVLTHWNDSEGIVWRSTVPGRGHSSPILVGDQVVLASAIEEEQQQLVSRSTEPAVPNDGERPFTKADSHPNGMCTRKRPMPTQPLPAMASDCSSQC